MTDNTLQPDGEQGKGLARRDFIRGAALTLVAVTAVAAAPGQAGSTTVNRFRPDGAPEGAGSSYEAEGLSLVTWGGAPVADGDLVVIEARDEIVAGIYRTGPGGYFTVENNEDDGPRRFRPSDVQLVARVMHIECAGVMVARFPLKGGAR